MQYQRRIRSEVVSALDDTRIVNLVGARQVGKTTLAEAISEAEKPMRFVTLDDQTTRDAAIRDPAGFVESLSGPTLIDEVQRAPELLLEIKRVVDRDRMPGQFLLTGPSNVLASNQIVDALTGRIETIRLWPLMQTEIEAGTSNFIDAIFQGSPPDVTGAPAGRKAIRGRLTAGGFPEVITRSENHRNAWYRSYVEASLASDLTAISDLTRVDEIPRLLRLLAANAANVLKYRTVAEGLDIGHETVKTYTGLLERLGLIVRLPGWRPGLAARETSKPKSFITDTGMLCYLLGADESRLGRDDQITGKAVENFVAMEILRHVNWSGEQVRLFHYHQPDRDVDLVVERNDGAIVAIEVKSTATIRPRDYRWLEFLRERTGARFVAGIVICTTAQRVPLGDRLWASPISALWQ